MKQLVRISDTAKLLERKGLKEELNSSSYLLFQRVSYM